MTINNFFTFVQNIFTAFSFREFLMNMAISVYAFFKYKNHKVHSFEHFEITKITYKDKEIHLNYDILKKYEELFYNFIENKNNIYTSLLNIGTVIEYIYKGSTYIYIIRSFNYKHQPIFEQDILLSAELIIPVIGNNPTLINWPQANLQFDKSRSDLLINITDHVKKLSGPHSDLNFTVEDFNNYFKNKLNLEKGMIIQILYLHSGVKEYTI